MTNKQQYRAIKEVQDRNQQEAKARITERFGGIPPNCENKRGDPICPFYSMCKQVKTYEAGEIPEPICALPDKEIAEFVIPLSFKKVGE